jgi:hypothetical protein
MRIKTAHGVFEVELNDSETAKIIQEAFPIESTVNKWGEEIYCDIKEDLELEEDATDVVDKGAVCYWPEGPALCIFYGPTPMSKGKECRAASLVNVIGKIKGPLEKLRDIQAHDKITFE